MFGKRAETDGPALKAPPSAEKEIVKKVEPTATPQPQGKSGNRSEPSEEYYETKATIFNALFETIDVSALAGMQPDKAREEIRTIVDEIIAIRNVRLSVVEQNQLITEICDDILGYGPLEPLLARDDIADIMVNGAKHVFIETNGKMQKTNIRFRDNTQLMNICQRIVSQVGRRVDEASPICDARLLDGSRVNVIAPPLSIDGPALTIPDLFILMSVLLLAKMRQNYNFSNPMLCGWKLVRLIWKARERLPWPTLLKTVCGCAQNGLSWVRCVVRKLSTFSKP